MIALSQLLPIDFECMVANNTQVKFSGYLVHAPEVAVEAYLTGGDYIAECAHDWFAACCVLFQRLCGDYASFAMLMNKSIKGPEEKGPKAALQTQFWNNVRKLSVWRTVFAAAARMDCDAVLNAVGVMFASSLFGFQPDLKVDITQDEQDLTQRGRLSEDVPRLPESALLQSPNRLMRQSTSMATTKAVRKL